MFMKHTISRFFRFFLVAALVAAMAGSLLPTKALGQTVTGEVTVVPSNNRAGAVAEFVITIADADIDANAQKVKLTFSNASIPSTIDRTDISVVGAAAAELLTVAPTVSGKNLEFFTPVANPTQVTISSTAGIAHGNTPGMATITVNGEKSTPYAINQYLSGRPGSAARNATVTVNGGGFSAGTSGDIGLYDDGIRGVSDYIIVEDNDGPNLDTSDPPVPELEGATIVKSIPLPADDVADVEGDMDTQGIQLSDEDVARGVMMREYPDLVDGECSEDTELTNLISGNDDAGMNRACNDAADVAPKTTGTGGTYTVDSSGALSGSFVATKNTAGGGKVQVTDLGTGVVVTGSSYSQKASAMPAATEAPLGSTLSVALVDFAAGSKFKATIAGMDRPFKPNANATKGDLTIGQTEETTGTKRVTITGTIMVPSGMQDDQGTGTEEDPIDEAADVAQTQTSSFLITIVSRTITVSPSSAVPGQAVTVSGSGFAPGTVDLTLTGGIKDSRATDITVNTDGTFLYTGRVPFTADTASAGSKTYTATSGDGSRAASSSGFSIQARAISLSPSTANPGATVEVFGSGWGVKTKGNATSQVTLTVTDTNAIFGPFPISSSGEFTGAITVPADVPTKNLMVTATDNNGSDGAETELTDGFPDPAVDPDGSGPLTADPDDKSMGNQSATKTLTVPTGVISVSPDTASTGSVITVTGAGFPAQTNLSMLHFGGGNALPVPAPATDVTGNFTVTLTVPAAAQGGSLPPGAVVITAKVGQIQGTTSFTIPGPSITLSASSASPGSTISVSGTNFSAYANVDTINVGQQNQSPTPNPLTDAVGNFSASVLVPALNPGAYTITVRTDPAFTATHAITIVSATAGGVTPEIAFQALTSRGLLVLAAAAAPGGTEFGAFVPGLAGNTLVQVDPNGVLVLTLNADARISVSSQAAVDVAANTPTFFALGANVSVEVIE